MTRSLRRSRRAPKTKSGYNVGDIVQIHRNGLILKGRLAQFLSEGSSPNPRWLLKFDGQPYKDEEMYEKSFGELLASADGEEDQGDSGSSQTSQKRATTTPSVGLRPNRSSKASGSSSEEGEVGDDSGMEPNSASEKIFRPADGSNTGSDTSSNVETFRGGMSSRVSAREARSKRRQAKIDEETVIPVDIAAPGDKRRQASASGNAKKRQRGDAEAGEVVKVKLLTGTLYLYRGQYRRVEFVRRV